MLGIGREKRVVGMHDFGAGLAGPFDRRAAEGEGRLGVHDVVLGVDELLDQLFVGPGPSQPVLGVEKKVPGGKAENLDVFALVHAVGIGRGVNMDLMAELGEFLGENLGGGGNPVDAGEVGVGDEGDFH
jgi:hypothetical protein